MTGRIEVEVEFLRRMLGAGDDDAPEVEVFPGTWPDDFPLRWPELAGTRVWGGVRSTATRWTFDYGNRRSLPPVARRLMQWRVCVDVAAPARQVMDTLQAELTRQGWQAGQLWQQAFVQHDQTTWNAVHVATSRLLTLQTRRAEDHTDVRAEDHTDAGPRTQVWLTVQDVEEEAVGHWLGQHSPSQFPDFSQAPLPSLSVPPGWQVIGQGGNGGAERSETALLIALEGQSVDLSALMSAFEPQLSAQGWTLLSRVQTDLLNAVWRAAQTPQGFGVLGLERMGEAISAKLVHITFGDPDAPAVSTYKLTSS